MRLVHSEAGFTLIEFLVSIVILMVGLMGLLQTVNFAIQHNMANEYRYEATRIADAEMVKEVGRGTNLASFTAISTVAKRYEVKRTMVNGFKNYSVLKTGAQPTPNTKEIIIEVSWRHRGQRYSQSSASIISAQQ